MLFSKTRQTCVDLHLVQLGRAWPMSSPCPSRWGAHAAGLHARGEDKAAELREAVGEEWWKGWGAILQAQRVEFGSLETPLMSSLCICPCLSVTLWAAALLRVLFELPAGLAGAAARSGGDHVQDLLRGRRAED